MIGLCCNEKYGAITKYDDGDDDGDNDGKEDRNDDDNAAAGSGFPWSDLIFNNDASVSWRRIGRWGAIALRTRRTMYLRAKLYIYPINTIVNMCHKLLNAKIGVLGLCC